jgi:hypothetical protein
MLGLGRIIHRYVNVALANSRGARFILNGNRSRAGPGANNVLNVQGNGMHPRTERSGQRPRQEVATPNQAEAPGINHIGMNIRHAPIEGQRHVDRCLAPGLGPKSMVQNWADATMLSRQKDAERRKR